MPSFFFFPVNVGSAPGVITTPGVEMTGHDLVKQALLKIAVLGVGEDLGDDDGELGLTHLNMLLDQWNGNQQASFATGFTGFTLTPALSPHTIGPTGTFVVPDRPARIDGINWITGGMRSPIYVRDQAWYQGLSMRTTTAATPTDVYYEPTVPNGKLWFYPVPTAANAIEIWTRGLLAAMTLESVILVPAGYRSALVKTLAEELVTPFHVQMPQGLEVQARQARALIFGNNMRIPRLVSDVRHGGGYYNYRSGLIE